MKRVLFALTMVLVIGLSFTKPHQSQSGQIITTVAGGNGDGVPALSSPIMIPRQAAVDAEGNLYIVDHGHNLIRKVDKNTGIITTVAGNGVLGFSGDGGQAVNAALSEPYGVALDAAGNIYIGDTGNRRVRKVDAATGIITTIGGTGCQSCPLGDGGQAVNASFPGPKGLAADRAGNIYVADTGTESRIRKIDKLTGVVTTVAGGGNAGPPDYGDGGPAANAVLGFVYSLAIDRDDNILIPETFANRVRKVDAATGIITTIAGNGGNGFSGDGGLATNASLSDPYAAATDSLGNIYITDTLNNRIRKVDAAGTITTVAGNGGFGSDGNGGPAVDATLGAPQGIAVDGDDNFYIANTGTEYIHKVDAATGIITAYAGNGNRYFSGDGGPATSATFGKTRGVAADFAGNLYISDNFDNRVRKVDAATGVITTVGNYNGPAGLALDSAGNLYIAENGSLRILKVNLSTGAATVAAGGGDPCAFVNCNPEDFITAAGQSNLVVGGIAENSIPTNSLTVSSGFFGDGGLATNAVLFAPNDVGVGSDGNIYITDAASANRIRMVDVAGKFGTAGNIYTVASGFNLPNGIDLDNDDNIYIADSGSRRIRKIDAATGAISTAAGNGCPTQSNPGCSLGDGGPALSASLSRPLDVQVDNFGNLYIADADFQRIRRVDAATSIITTVAGNGTKGFSGDGGPAVSANLNAPNSAALYFGKLYIADTDNKRVRAVEVDGGCNFILTPTRKDAASGASTGNTIAVNASSAGCNWTASANASWLHITGGASGTGNGTVTYSIDVNSGPERTGTLTVAGITITVRQPNGCSFLLGASGANVPHTASAGNTVEVNASDAGCSWTAVSNDGWIQITSGDGGSGDGTVTYSADANPDAERVGTLTIAGITFTVNQSAIPPCLLAITSGAPPSGVQGQAYSFAFASNTPGTVFVVASGSLPSGLTLNSATGALSGAPSLAGAYTFTLKADNAGVGCTTVYQSYTISISSTSGCTSVSFTPKTDYETFAVPNFAATGDINGDGKLDIATANPNNNSVSVLLRFQDGFISSAGFGVDVNRGPVSVALGDLNNDGKLDAVTANVLNDTVSVRLGAGNGSFNFMPDNPVGTDPQSAALGDFNGDGKLDVVTANSSGNTVSVLLGAGNGTFGAKTDFATGSGPRSAAVGDLNGDGKLDIVTANSSGNSVSVLLGVGNGTFGAKTDYAVGAIPNSAALGDFNGDGKLDVVTSNFIGSTVSVLLGVGNGTLGAKTDYAVATNPRSVASADLNGDGKLDIFSTATPGGVATPSTLSVLLGVGNGTFGAKTDYTLGPQAFSGAAGDFNGDGKPDVAAVNGGGAGSVSVLYNTCGIPILTATVLPVGLNFNSQTVGSTSSPQAITITSTGNTAVNITNVSITGLAGSSFAQTNNCVGNPLAPGSSCTVNVAFSPNTSGFHGAEVVIEGNAANFPRSVSLQGSAQCAYSLSALSANVPKTASSGNTVAVNTAGNCSWTASSSSSWLHITSISGFSGNGTVTYSVDANPGAARSGGLVIAGIGFIVNQESGFSCQYSITSGNPPSGTRGQPYSFTFTSNTPGTLFSVVSGSLPPGLTLNSATGVLSGTPIVMGDYTFAAAAFKSPVQCDIVPQTYAVSIASPSYCASFSFVALDYPTAASSNSGALGDLNGDGKPDLITVNSNGSNPGTASVLLGAGNGTFGAKTDYTVGASPASAALGDLNGDGKLDLVTANSGSGSNSVSVLLGAGNGTFGAKTDFTVGTSPISAALGDLNGDGKLDLVSANIGSSTVSVLLGAGNGTFGAKTDFTVGANPNSAALGDLNGDGKLDIVTANTGFTVSVLLGVGNGSFGAKTDFTVGASSYSTALGDVNSDGKLDLVAANRDDNKVSVLLGVGNGTFGGKIDVAIGVSPRSAALGDLNEDGKPDLITANGSAGTISVLLGVGNGSFNAKTDYTVGAFTASATIGDVNGDGKSDIAAVKNAGAVSILLNTCGTSISAATVSTNALNFGSQAVPGTSAPKTVTITNKGNISLNISSVSTAGANSGEFAQTNNCVGNAIAPGGTCTVNVAFTPNDSGLRNATLIIESNAINGPHSIALEGIGQCSYSLSAILANAAAAASAGNTVAVNTSGACGWTASANASWLHITSGSSGNGAGTVVYSVDANTGTARFGTLTIAGIAFTVSQASGCTFAITSGNPPGGVQGQAYSFAFTTNTPGSAYTIANGTLPPGLTLNSTTGEVSGAPSAAGVYTFTLTATNTTAECTSVSQSYTITAASSSPCADFYFSAHTDYTVGTNPASAATGDLNGDGKLDIIVANSVSNNVSVLLGNGNGTFGTKTDYAVGSFPRSAVLGDVNGDGKLDIIAANNNNTVSVLLGAGNGTFGAKTDFAAGANPIAAALGDVNGDGKLDVVTANFNSAGTVSVLLGAGNGTFGAKTDFTVGSLPRSVTIRDFNGDGKLDIAAANNVSNSVSVLLGIGNGTFAPKTDYPVGTSPNSAAAGDFNGDGKLDLVVSNGNSFNVSVLLGIGNGTFAAKTDYPVGTSPNSAAVGDINGDGKLDIVTANFGSTVSVLLGNGNGTFAAKTDYPVGTSPNSTAVGDFNGDGKLDIAAAFAPLIGGVGSVSILLSNCCPDILLSPTELTLPTLGQSYTQTVTASGGATPYSFAKTSGTLPSGLTLSTTGVISGFPSQIGIYSFTITAADNIGCKGSRAYTLNIGKLDQTIAFGALADKTFGDAPFTVSAAASSGLAVSFSIESGPATVSGNTVTLTGAGTVVVRASQEGNANYNAAADVEQSFAVGKASATIALSNLSQTYNGSPKSATATTNPSNLTGVTITYNGLTASPTDVGSYDVVASLNNQNYDAPDATATLAIDKGAPTITWNNPADIAYGTALSGVHLNASTNVPGSFAYTPEAGTVLNVGNDQTLSVTFTPNDAANYNSASKSVLIDVVKATPTITWNNPPNIPYGAALSNAQLNASANVPGAFEYNPPAGTVLNAGNGQTLSVAFTPNDAANYNNASKSVTINVAKANTATQLVSNHNPSISGQSVTFSAAVSSSAGAPSGTVTFKDGTATLGIVTLTDGQAAFSISNLTSGAHAITAVYSGDSNFNTSTSAPLTQTVGNTPTGSNVSITPIDPATGQPGRATITFSNVITPGTTTVTSSTTGTPPPNGFKIGNPPIFYDIDTTAVFSGPIEICIDYSNASYRRESRLKLFHYENGQWVNRTVDLDTEGDIICAQVTSLSPFLIAEEQLDTAVSITSSVNPAAVSQSTTFTATVSSSESGFTGSVAFFDGAAALGTQTLNASGQATLTTSSLSAGSHSIKAVYNGDDDFKSSTSSALNQTVNCPPITITAPANINKTTGTGAGSCTVFISNTELGTATASSGCVVNITHTGVPAGNLFPIGATTITYTGTDASGQTATAAQTVTVADNTLPTIVAPPAVFKLSTTLPVPLTSVGLGTPTTGDNCSVASVTNNAPSTFPAGITTVTWTVRDASGNTATATQSVRIVPAAKIEVISSVYTIGLQSPFLTITPLNLSLKVFDHQGRVFIPTQMGETWESGSGITPPTAAISGPTGTSLGIGSSNLYTILVPSNHSANANLTSGRYITVGKGAVGNTSLYVGDHNLVSLPTGVTARHYLQVIATANGRIIPAKTTDLTGSLLLVVEPAYLEFVPSEDVLPVIYQSVEGNWSSNIEFTPPQGFTSEPGSLSASVNSNEAQVLQFTVRTSETGQMASKIGAMADEVKQVQLTHRMMHNGAPRTLSSRIDILQRKLDIVAANFTPNGAGSISLMAGNGNGSFGLPTSTTSTGPGTFGIDSGDFNNDGKRDVVVTNFGNTNSASKTLTIYFGDGTGNFPRSATVEAAAQPVYVVAAYLNRDRNLDLAVACRGTSAGAGKVAVLLGNGNGTFKPAALYDAGNEPLYLAVGFLNFDLDLDIAVTSRQDPHPVRVLKNKGDGAFTVSIITAFDAPNTASPIGVAVFDFNRDLKFDIAVANSGTNAGPLNEYKVTVAYGDGLGNFGNPQFFKTGMKPYGISVGFFDANLSPDLVVAGGDNPDERNVGKLAVLLNNGTGVFTARPFMQFGRGIRVPRVGLLNNDLRLDIAIDSADGNVYVLLGNGTGGFTVAPYSAGTNPAQITIGEFNSQ